METQNNRSTAAQETQGGSFGALVILLLVAIPAVMAYKDLSTVNPDVTVTKIGGTVGKEVGIDYAKVVKAAENGTLRLPATGQSK